MLSYKTIYKKAAWYNPLDWLGKSDVKTTNAALAFLRAGGDQLIGSGDAFFRRARGQYDLEWLSRNNPALYRKVLLAKQKNPKFSVNRQSFLAMYDKMHKDLMKQLKDDYTIADAAGRLTAEVLPYALPVGGIALNTGKGAISAAKSGYNMYKGLKAAKALSKITAPQLWQGTKGLTGSALSGIKNSLAQVFSKLGLKYAGRQAAGLAAFLGADYIADKAIRDSIEKDNTLDLASKVKLYKLRQNLKDNISSALLLNAINGLNKSRFKDALSGYTDSAYGRSIFNPLYYLTMHKLDDINKGVLPSTAFLDFSRLNKPVDYGYNLSINNALAKHRLFSARTLAPKAAQMLADFRKPLSRTAEFFKFIPNYFTPWYVDLATQALIGTLYPRYYQDKDNQTYVNMHQW